MRKKQNNTVKLTTEESFFEGLKQATRKESILICGHLYMGGKSSVNGIYRTMNLEQSSTSAFLKRMRTFGFVKGERSGKSIVYVYRTQNVVKIYGKRNADMLEKLYEKKMNEVLPKLKK